MSGLHGRSDSTLGIGRLSTVRRTFPQTPPNQTHFFDLSTMACSNMSYELRRLRKISSGLRPQPISATVAPGLASEALLDKGVGAADGGGVPFPGLHEDGGQRDVDRQVFRVCLYRSLLAAQAPFVTTWVQSARLSVVYLATVLAKVNLQPGGSVKKVENLSFLPVAFAKQMAYLKCVSIYPQLRWVFNEGETVNVFDSGAARRARRGRHRAAPAALRGGQL